MSPDERGVLFESLVRNELPYLWNSLRRLGVPESDREDVLQEIFVRVHGAMEGYDASRAARPWLFAFAYRVASDYRKRARYRSTVEWTEEMGMTASGVDEAVDTRRRRVLLQRAIDMLDDERRAVIILHDIDGVPIPDVAVALGIPEGTAYTRLRAARSSVAQTLKRALAAVEAP